MQLDGRMISFWLAAPKGKTLIAAILLIGLVALVDAHTNPSLAVLYILPMMLGALVMGPRGTLVLALVCGIVQSPFDHSPDETERVFHLCFAALSYAMSGLLISSLVRNRRVVAGHLVTLQKEQQR